MRFAVLGGGAAGFFAALEAKRIAPGLDVLILESAARPLGKVTISGGGRCNVTTSCSEPDRLVEHYPRGGLALLSLFHRFGPRDTVGWFESRGVRLKTEPDGRIFPVTDRSSTIVDCLLAEARRLGVELSTRCAVRTLARDGRRFLVGAACGDVQADRVLIAAGGTPKAAGWARALGHHPIPAVPSLFTFQIDDPRLEGLAGISLPHARGRLEVEGCEPVEAEGPLLITHWGLSGPLVLRLSAWGARPLAAAGYQADLVLDLVPGAGDLMGLLRQTKDGAGRRNVGNLCPLPLPRRLWHRLAAHAGADPGRRWAAIPGIALASLAEGMARARFRIRGKGVFKEEFVTAGGVPLEEVDLRTMESRLCPGLHIAGEALDVDGLTGGFNFQNAWSGGWAAGQAVGQRALQSP